MIKVAPSILAADFGHLSREIKSIETAGADMIHFDVMDGVFVPNISFGIPVLASLKKEASIPFDVHLMIVNPEKYFKAFRDAGADMITFHAEAVDNHKEALNQIKALGMRTGISVKPKTPIEEIEEVLNLCDMVLVMSVEPGYGGQKLMPEVLEKGKQLRTIAEKKGLMFDIQIDGGINVDNAPMIASYGFNVLVAGTAVFRAENPAKAIAKMKGI